MNLITVDFETYYDKDFALRKMTTEAYIRDPRFGDPDGGARDGTNGPHR